MNKRDVVLTRIYFNEDNSVVALFVDYDPEPYFSVPCCNVTEDRRHKIGQAMIDCFMICVDARHPTGDDLQ